MWNIFPNHLFNQLCGIHFSLDAAVLISTKYLFVYLIFTSKSFCKQVFSLKKKNIIFKTLVSVLYTISYLVSC